MNLLLSRRHQANFWPTPAGRWELRDKNDILVDELIYGKPKEGQVMGETATGTPDNMVAPAVKKTVSKIKIMGD